MSVRSSAVKIAQYLNLSCTLFYPLLNIFGRQIKTAVYIKSPMLIQGNTTIDDSSCNTKAAKTPTISPEFTNVNNLSAKL